MRSFEKKCMRSPGRRLYLARRSWMGASSMVDGPLRLVLRHVRKLAGAPDEPAPSDGALLERFASGNDERAFEELLRRHAALVLGVCRRVLSRGQDVEDAFQATFLVLVRKAASLKR